MEVSSIKNLCKQLVSFAIQRCRLSGDPCRVSVVIRRSTVADTPVTQISISDTGAGSCLKEFQDLKYVSNGFSTTPWDGVLSITTTSIGEPEISQYELNLKEISCNRRLTKLPSTSKKSVNFSGTEVSMSTAEDMEILLADMSSYIKKMLILNMFNIAIELVAEFCDQHELQRENVVLATELTLSSPESSNIGQLTSGLEDFVHKHGHGSIERCQSCFSSSDSLKMGSGQACTKKNLNDTLVVEAVIIISESLEPSNPLCIKSFEPKTEVLYFRDFSPCPVQRSAVKALKSIKWINYGLNLRSITDDESSVLLEWENLPTNTHIDIVLHCYRKQVVVPQSRPKAQVEYRLMKESISLALDDLKERYSGLLLSAHAVKIHSYAPDLARSVAGLILSSDDPNFQVECLSLLGMQMGNTEGALVEECIKQKIMSAIDMNDRKPPNLRCKEPVPFLFGDENIQEPEYIWDECEGGDEEDCTFMEF